MIIRMRVGQRNLIDYPILNKLTNSKSGMVPNGWLVRTVPDKSDFPPEPVRKLIKINFASNCKPGKALFLPAC
jgi:hypothetical protein